MLRFLTTVFKPDPKYKKELKVAGLILAIGYISLLALVYITFHSEDAFHAMQPAKTVDFTTPKVFLSTMR